MKLWQLLAATTLLAGAAMAPLQAAQDTGTLTVTATVKSNCDVGSGALAFGEYVTGQAGNLDATGTIQIANCPNSTVKLELDGGSSGSATARQMKAGTNALAYQIYKDAGRTQAWAAGADGLNVTTTATSVFNVTVYGRIPGSQAVAPGNYTDTVTITMTF